jgi:ABC-type sugar transport system substrate-binding protein
MKTQFLMHRAIRGRSRGWQLAGALAGAALLAGCSSSSGSSSAAGPTGSATASAGTGGANGATSSACMTAANTYLKPFDTLPTKLDAATYPPLASAPPRGLTVVKIVGPIPTDQQSFEAQAVAAKAIGWTAKEVTYDGSVQGLNTAFTQAIAEKPAMITYAGAAVADIQAPLAAAKQAGIVVSLSSTIDPPTSYPGYAANSNGLVPTQQIGQIEAYEFMRASNCQGNVAVFNLQGLPILKTGVDAFQDTVAKHCPGCTVTINNVAVTDIGTPALTSAVVSKLQSSPQTKYVLTVIGNVADGLSTALTQAGISGIQIFGADPDDNSLAALRNGTNAFWVNQSPISNAWTELDAGLRAMQTKSTVTVAGNYPLSVLTPKNVPSGTGLPVFPSTYQQQFEQIWRVAGAEQ